MQQVAQSLQHCEEYLEGMHKMMTYLEYRGPRLQFQSAWGSCNLQQAYYQNCSGTSSAPPPAAMQMGLFSEGLGMNPWDSLMAELQIVGPAQYMQPNEAFNALMHRLQIASEVLALRMFDTSHGCSYAEMSQQTVHTLQSWTQAADMMLVQMRQLLQNGQDPAEVQSAIVRQFGHILRSFVPVEVQHLVHDVHQNPFEAGNTWIAENAGWTRGSSSGHSASHRAPHEAGSGPWNRWERGASSSSMQSPSAENAGWASPGNAGWAAQQTPWHAE